MAKKRKYQKDPNKKIKDGKPWRLTVVLDKDNAKNILAEVNKNGEGSGKAYYQGVINKRIRDSYSKTTQTT